MSEIKRTVLRCPLCGGWLDLTASKPVEAPVLHDPGAPITDRQRKCIFAIVKRKNLVEPERISGWTKGQASAWIEQNGS
jgi:hypothetical protein